MNTEAPPTGKCPIIIVADDELAMCELVAEHVASLGQVEAIHGGPALKERLEAAADGSKPIPSVVLSDVRMPVYGGMDALRFVKTNLPRVSVVLVTAFGDAFLHHRARMLGAFAVIDKPFKGEEIVDAVEAACRMACLPAALG